MYNLNLYLLMDNPIILIEIDNKVYEKVYECINLVGTTLPQTYLKNNYKKIEREYTYTQEMQDKANIILQKKKIADKNEEIDAHKWVIMYINLRVENTKEIDMINFICNKLFKINKDDNKKLNKKEIKLIKY